MELSDKQIQILEVAEKLFAENGFDGTSIRSIAKAAKVNVAMISYYFGSKEKMLEALLYHRNVGFREEAEALFALDQEYFKTVDDLVAMIVNRVHAKRRIHKILHFEYSNACRKLDFDQFLEQKKSNYRLVEEFIQKGQEAGVFVKNIDIFLIYPTILGTYFNFYYNKKFYVSLYNLKEEEPLDQFVQNTLIPHIQKTIKALLTYEA